MFQASCACILRATLSGGVQEVSAAPWVEKFFETQAGWTFSDKPKSIDTIDALPVSPNGKAVMYLTENHRQERGCRSCHKVQQKLAERALTINVLESYPAGANFLVFGLGFDSVMWTALNKGRTVFLEDNDHWLGLITEKWPFVEAYKVSYTTRLLDYPASIAQQRREPACRDLNNVGDDCFLKLELPAALKDVEWDIIMVDAPAGTVPAKVNNPVASRHSYVSENLPTRQMPIFTAASLARSKPSTRPTHIMVHDVHREIERVFSDTYLCEPNLVRKLERSGRLFSGSRLGLRHYTLSSRTDDASQCPTS